jgi:gamma-glutamyltranspeptidase/glutathione hydrolase
MSADRYAGLAAMPLLGWGSVTVPGAVSAWAALSERYGQLPFADLFEAAIGYAADGFQVGPKTAYYWKLAEQSFAAFPDFVDHFLPAPGPGERFRRPDMVASLEQIASSGGEAFYRGALAADIAAAAEAAGGALRLADLESHQADWVAPIEQPYGRVSLHEIPPNGQGLAAQIALALLAEGGPASFTAVAGLHRQIECMKIAVRAAFDHLADPDAMRLTPAELLGPESIRRAAATIGERASQLPPVALPVGHDTVYLCAADDEGRMISFIQSNYLGFGSGIVIPGTGISMQNRGMGFSLDPAHPNCVGPGKRPFHTIIPGFATEAGAPRLAFGVMGGHMQHQGHFQMVQRLFDHGENPQAASDAPRWHVFPDFSVGLEPGFPETLASGLTELGHSVRYVDEEHVFGGAQLILKTEHGYVAGSDHRKEGQAAGF